MLLPCCYSYFSGNVPGKKPYLMGPSCTKCDSGVGQCYNNLCRKFPDYYDFNVFKDNIVTINMA